ncbi:MAG: hypothetical protein K2Y39_06110 [Candidatus Obscuribacterales bacterium]|nr:hypothetical protein [Candidatus Obscuribacterales bacterium]
MNSESLDSFQLAPGKKDQSHKRNLREQTQFGTAGQISEERSCSGNVCEAIWKPSVESRMLRGQNS